MKKMYLVVEIDDYGTTNLILVSDKLVADKIYNGFDDTLSNFMGDQPEIYCDAYYEYWDSRGYDPYDLPIYSVQEVEYYDI